MLPGYLEGIQEAGGTPVIFPLTEDREELEQLCSLCNGFLITGGQDVDPVSYTHLILALETPGADEQLKVRAVKTEDGKLWWAAFTSFEEELKGGGSVMSTFLPGIHPLFESALKTEGIEGVIINPWNRTLMLDKNLIQIVLGQQKGDS